MSGSSSPHPISAVAAQAAPSSAAPAPSKEASAQAVTKIGRIFAKNVPNISKLKQEYSRSGIGYIADAHSQNLQLLQNIEPGRDYPTLGLLNYNNFSRFVTRSVDFFVYVWEGTKALKSQGMSAIRGPESASKIEKAKTVYTKVSDLTQGASLTAYQVCSTVGTGVKIAKNVGTNISTGFEEASSRISTAGYSLLTIFSALRAIQAIGSFFKTSRQKAFLKKPILLNDKMAALESLLEVQDAEVRKYIDKNNKQKQNTSDFLSSYLKRQQATHALEIASKMGLKQLPDFTDITAGIATGSYRAFLKQKFQISDSLDTECTTSEAFLGLLLLKSELSIKKQEAFLDSFAESTLHREKISKLMKSAIKARQIGTSMYSPQELDVTLMNLFESIKVGMKRKQMKNLVVILSAVLTIAACVALILCPAAIIPITILFIVSNFLEFGLSQREFRNMALELDAAQAHLRPAGSSSLLSRVGQALYAMPWRNKLSMAVSMASLVLFLCCLLTPIGAGIAVSSLIASGIAVSLFFVYNLATVNKYTRDLMVKKADFCDQYINQKFGYFGSAIEESRAEKTQQEQMKLVRFHVKLNAMTDALLDELLRSFALDDARLEARKTSLQSPGEDEAVVLRRAKIDLIKEESQRLGLQQSLQNYRRVKSAILSQTMPIVAPNPVLITASPAGSPGVLPQGSTAASIAAQAAPSHP